MRLSRKTLVLLTVFIISGCSSSASTSRIYTANGQRGYAINCSGVKRDWGACYQKAGSICEELGYEVLEVTGESGTMTDVTSSSQTSTAKTTTTHNRIMVIECKHPPAPDLNARKVPSGNQ